MNENVSNPEADAMDGGQGVEPRMNEMNAETEMQPRSAQESTEGKEEKAPIDAKERESGKEVSEEQMAQPERRPPWAPYWCGWGRPKAEVDTQPRMDTLESTNNQAPPTRRDEDASTKEEPIGEGLNELNALDKLDRLHGEAPLPGPLPGAEREAAGGSTESRPTSDEEARGDSRPPGPGARPTEGVDGAKLLDELRDTIRRFVVLPENGPETLALWILHTHAFHLRNVTTYVGVQSPEKRCGKSTLLGVLCDLVARPVIAANISPSAFFRVIQERRPTLLIDEADTFLEGNDELRGILNAGYSRKAAYVVRVANQKVKSEESQARNERRARSAYVASQVWQREREVNDSGPCGPSGQSGQGSQLAEFSTWCPKAIAAIGRLPETLADRCIVITMQRKRSSEKCERLKRLDGAFLRLQCERFVEQNAIEIGRAHPQVPPSLNDRAADIWEPLLALADLAGANWPELGRKAAVHLSGASQELTSIASMLIRDIQVIFDTSGADRLFTRDIVSLLNNLPERPWNERRKMLTEIWLASQLRPYGIKPKPLRMAEEMARGYERVEFEEVFDRYAPKRKGEGEVK